MSLDCILSIHQVLDSPIPTHILQAATALGHPEYATIEFCLWAFMIHQKSQNGFFAPYLSSLADVSPCPFQWPIELLEILEGTNLASVCSDDMFSSHQSVIAELVNSDSAIFSPTDFDLNALKWAKGHYISRRYPNKYSLGKKRDYSEFARERGLDAVGALIPLLDLLNHKPGEQRLEFEVSNGQFHVRTHIPVQAVYPRNLRFQDSL